MTRLRNALCCVAFAALGVTVARAEPLFWSTQARPVEELARMRGQVLQAFPGGVDYRAVDEGLWLARLQAELRAGSGEIALLGGLHGDFAAVAADLADPGDAAAGVEIAPALMALGRLGGARQKYIPWMQASYVMAANRKALAHLPAGADLDRLSYEQFIAWMAALSQAAGAPKFGLPAGPGGLNHRFLQGYLLPAHTGSMVRGFRSDAAAAAWRVMRALWAHVDPASTTYAFMQEPLLSEAVWVAFDHTSRLAEAFNRRPGDFVAFPPPAGPAGRAFMAVIAGLAIPRTAPDIALSRALMAHMLAPDTQIATLRATTFFPVVEAALPADLPPAVLAAGQAIAAMLDAPDALAALPPVGLGDRGGAFNAIYRDAFARIVLNGEDIADVVDAQAAALRALIVAAGAPCWAPDAPSGFDPCPVD